MEGRGASMETHRWTRRLVKVSGRAGSLVDRRSPSSRASVMGGASGDGCHASVGPRGVVGVRVQSKAMGPLRSPRKDSEGTP